MDADTRDDLPFRIRQQDRVLHVVFDTPGEKVNVISRAFFRGFGELLDRIESDESIAVVVLESAKTDNFLAGADLDEILSMSSSREASAFVREAHRLLDRVAGSRKPVIAAIHGAALGGGLEIALACHYRIATEHPATVLGLPEAMIGLIPAGGGTQRLPRLIGLARALPIMLSGKRIRARKALEYGLIDEIATPDSLPEVVDRACSRLLRGRPLSNRRSRSFLQRLTNFAPVRGFVLRRAREAVRKKTGSHYRAPHALLDAVETGLRDGFEAGRQKEIELFGTLVTSAGSRHLIWLFKATTDLKRPPVDAPPRAIARLGVIGAGLMGEGIASISIDLAAVILQDISEETLHRATERIAHNLERRVRSGSVGAELPGGGKRKLKTSTSARDLEECDLVIEAVFENRDLKRQVLADAETVLTSDAVFASNTSAIPIADIAAGALHPERVLGMHYFSPVPKMPLLEIVRTEKTAHRAIATAHAFGTAQGKTVIVVRDGPGFYTTRILAPFMNEAIVLLGEGAEIDALDAALRQYGFPVGPVTLLDEVGLDVATHVSRDLGQAFAARGLAPSDILPRMVEAGYGGRKNGKGFFLYEPENRHGSRPINPDVSRFFGGADGKAIDSREMADRLSLLMINEAVWCLQEGILSSARDGDVGAILGLGFPPFRGGPFHTVDAAGPESVVRRMRELASRLGARFEPAPLLVEIAGNGERFYA